jgi:hypothetical protein
MAALFLQTSTQPTCIIRALRRAARSSAAVFGRRPAWTLSSAA